MNADRRLLPGIAVGLAAASIGALYTVFARWGISQGMEASDMTFLRFAVAGLVMLPFLVRVLWADTKSFFVQWRAWLAVSLLAGPLFGILMFTALQWAPASHAAVFPFAAMSVMGTIMSAWVLKEPLSPRKLVGVVIIIAGLLVLSGLETNTLSAKTLAGDALFVTAGTLWAGFGMVMRTKRLNPMVATSVISFAALVTYVPTYLHVIGMSRLLAVPASVFWTELIIQGLIAGVGTLYTYSKMVSLLGPARAALFPALAPGIAALLAWPVLGHMPSVTELTGLLISIAGLIWTVTGTSARASSKPIAAPYFSTNPKATQ